MPLSREEFQAVYQRVIQSAPAGLSREQFNALLDSELAKATPQPEPEQKSAGGFLGNAINSTGRFLVDTAKGLGSAAVEGSPVGFLRTLANPQARVEQAKSMAGDVGRLAVNASPGGMLRTSSGARPVALPQGIEQRYGSPSQALETAYQDPAGVVGDVLSMAPQRAVSAVAGAVGKPFRWATREGGIAAVRGTLRPPQAIRDDFGGSRAIAETVLDEGLGTRSVADRKLSEASDATNAALTKAEAAGAPGVSPRVMVRALKGEPTAMAARRAKLGESGGMHGGLPGDELARQARQIHTQNRGSRPIPLSEANVLKREAQDLAYEAGQQSLSVKKAAEKAKAQALRAGVEESAKAVGVDVGPMNERTQRLLGAKRAWDVADDRPAALSKMLAIPTLGSSLLLDSPRAGAAIGIGLDRTGRALTSAEMLRAALLARLNGQN